MPSIIELATAFFASMLPGKTKIDKEHNVRKLVDGTRTLRELIQSDPHRPVYHFVAPEGKAMPFDPNGALFWKGKYHLGYIYQRTINGEQRHVWGHVVSVDLLHWTIYPDMLDVKDGDAEEGIFSGAAFVSKSGVPHIAYYGLGASANMLAYAIDDDLKKWRKLSRPILRATDPNDPGQWSCCTWPRGKYTVFDPDVWYDDVSDYYYQISGGMKPGFFRSRDMYEWEYLGNPVSATDEMRLPFEDLSCPDFFSVGEKHMLIFISHSRGAQYYIGTFADSKFTAERHGRMSWPGGSLFALEHLKDESGRNIIWGWVYDPRADGQKNYGWSGIMSLPRVLTLDDTGELQIRPPDEMKRIRINEVKEADTTLTPNQEMTLRGSGKSVELIVEMESGSLSPFGVKVFASPDGREETVIRFDPEHEQLVIDFVKSSIDGPVSFAYAGDKTTEVLKPVLEYTSEQTAPLKLRDGEALQLNIFLDRSIIEVFANGRQAVTQMVYPKLETSVGIKVFSGNDALAVRNIRCWTMAETNPY